MLEESRTVAELEERIFSVRDASKRESSVQLLHALRRELDTDEMEAVREALKTVLALTKYALRAQEG